MLWINLSLTLPCGEYQALKKTTLKALHDYQERLGIYKNPFRFAITIDEANRIYINLLKRSIEDECIGSPLFKIQNELKQIRAKTFNTKLVDAIIDDALMLLKSKETQLKDLQSNVLALQALDEYIEHFKACPKGEHPFEEHNDKLNMPSDEYSPHTKDSTDIEGPKQRIAEANFNTAYFYHATYTSIARNRSHVFQARKRFWDAAPKSYELAESKTLTVKTAGAKLLRLLIPSGYIPAKTLEPDVYVEDRGNGSYDVILKKEYATVTITLEKPKANTLTQLQHEIATQRVGFDVHEWPDDIQIGIINAYNKDTDHPATIAKAIADHIATQYTYIKNAKPEKDPISALKSGSFQCDMAAYIMVSIIRDVFAIPCRVVAGYKAQQDSDTSYVELPNNAHMWVEVFYDDAWHTYDPAPASPAQQQESNVEPEKSKLNKNTERTDQNDDARQEDYPTVHHDNNGLINPLKHYLIELLCTYTFNPLSSSDAILARLNAVKSLFNKANDAQKIKTEEGELLHTKPHPTLYEWLKNLNGKIFEQKITTTYKEIMQMISILIHCQSYVKIDTTTTNVLEEIVKELKAVLKLLDGLKDYAPLDTTLVEEFKETCPPLIWQAVSQEYELTKPGTIDINRLADDLKAGKLNNKLLINAVYKHSNFILQGSKKPKYSLSKKWQVDAPKRGRDLVPVDRLNDWNKVIARPGQDVLKSIARGQAYMLSKRKKELTKEKGPVKEEERITIVGFDTSASMQGELETFQEALILAFISRALSDTSPQGHHRHKVVLVPFDNKIGQPVKITNAQEALYILKNRDLFKTTRGGTDIQAFLLKAMELIANAGLFDGANIVVITDGQSKIDYDVLKKAREAIDRKTPLQTLFVALGKSNSELKKFALDSEKMGAQEGFYQEFSTSEILKIIKNASITSLEKNAPQYHSLKNPHDIPKSAQTHILTSIKKVKALDKILRENMYKTPYQSFIPILAGAHKKNRHTIPYLKNWILELRHIFKEYTALHDDALLNFLLASLMENFHEYTGASLAQLDYKESAQLAHLLQTPY